MLLTLGGGDDDDDNGGGWLIGLTVGSWPCSAVHFCIRPNRSSKPGGQWNSRELAVCWAGASRRIDVGGVVGEPHGVLFACPSQVIERARARDESVTKETNVIPL